MDFLNNGTLYTDLIKNQLGQIKEGESRHIEIDSRFNCFIYYVGENKYNGWFYWVNGADPVMTFENLDIKEIVYKAYDAGILSSFTEGSLYNEKVTGQLMSNMTSMANLDQILESNQKIENEVPILASPDSISTASNYQSIHTEVIDGVVYIKISKGLQDLVSDRVLKAYPNLQADKASDIAKIIISSCYRGSNV